MFKFGAEEMAKVLHFYGLLDDTSLEYKIICPFHEDVNPSMKINLVNGEFFCFGCNVQGDAQEFVALIHKKKKPIIQWQKFYRILRSKKTRKIKAKVGRLKKRGTKEQLDNAQKHYEEIGKTDWRDVFRKHYLFKRGYKPKTLTLNGVKVNTSFNYPIIAPIMDNGVFRGTVARTTNKKVERKRKYLYNKGFSRAETLCGDYSKPWIIITEGCFDLLKLKQNLRGLKGGKKFIDNCVCILGWKPTQYQIEQLKKYADNRIISALDDTGTGEKGTEVLKQHFKYVVPFQYDGIAKDQGDLDQHSFNQCFLDTLDEVEKVEKTIRRKRNNGEKQKQKRKRR